MVPFRNVICTMGNVLNRAKWPFKFHSDVIRNGELFYSAKSEVELPLPPKRPPTAYMMFCKETRPDIVKQYPSLSGPDLVKILAQRWAILTPLGKKHYEESARESTIVYGKLHKEFYENLTDEQRDELHKQKVEKRENKKLLKLKRALKLSGMPRFPSNAYSIFVQSKAKEVGKIKNGPNFIKQAAAEWNSFTEEEKKVFYEKAEENKSRYEREVTKWREKLVEEGNIDLLKSYEEIKHRHRVMASAADPGISVSKKTKVTKDVLTSKKPGKN